MANPVAVAIVEAVFGNDGVYLKGIGYARMIKNANVGMTNRLKAIEDFPKSRILSSVSP